MRSGLGGCRWGRAQLALSTLQGTHTLRAAAASTCLTLASSTDLDVIWCWSARSLNFSLILTIFFRVCKMSLSTPVVFSSSACGKSLGHRQPTLVRKYHRAYAANRYNSNNKREKGEKKEEEEGTTNNENKENKNCTKNPTGL